VVSSIIAFKLVSAKTNSLQLVVNPEEGMLPDAAILWCLQIMMRAANVKKFCLCLSTKPMIENTSGSYSMLSHV
jgi:hypothetical protein